MAVLGDLIVKASLFMVVAAAGVGLMRRASAASRHLVWTTALLAAVLLPVARLALPAMTFFVLPPGLTQAADPPARGLAHPAPDRAAAFAPSTAPGAGAVGRPAPTAPTAPAPVPMWPLSSILAGVWMAGAAAFLLKGTMGAARARRLARHARPATDPRLLTRLTATATRLGVRRPVTLLMASHEWMPSTWGVARPAILLPMSATAWLDEHPDRLEAVLAHEVAHIARVDALSQMVARLAVALFWFNPLVWFAARQARLERERACDDVVLAGGLRPSHYADDLLTLAQSLAPPAPASAAALAMARRSQLDRRILALLDDRVNRRGVSQTSLVIATALAILMLPLAAARLAARPSTPPGSSAALPDPDLAAPAAAPVTVAPAPEGRIAAPPIQTPQATPSPQASPSPSPGPPVLSQGAKWRLEGGQMARQLLYRAQNYVRDVQTRIAIGTRPPIDPKGPEQTLAAVKAIAPGLRHDQSPFVWVPSPTDSEIAAVRDRYTEALRNLDAALTRFDHGLAGTAEVDAAFAAAIAALTDPPAPPLPPGALALGEVRFASRSGAHEMQHVFTYANFPGQRTTIEDEFARGTVPESTPFLAKPVPRHHPLPKYTAEAMRAKIQGEVLVDVVVGTDGKVIRARIAQSLDAVYGLDEEALKAAGQWAFEPGVLNGEKVPVLVRVTLPFRLH